MKPTQTKFEKKICSILKKCSIEYKENEKIANYYVDLLLPKYNLIIEADGEQHQYGNKNSQYYYDLRRSKVLQELGYRIVRLTNNQINHLSPTFFERLYRASLLLGSPVKINNVNSKNRRVGNCIKGFSRNPR